MLEKIILLISSFYMPFCYEVYIEKRVSFRRRIIGYIGCALTMFLVGLFQISESCLPLIFLVSAFFLYGVCKVKIKELWIIIASYLQCALVSCFFDYILMTIFNLESYSERLSIAIILSLVGIVITSYLIKKMIVYITGMISIKKKPVFLYIVVCNILLLSVLVIVNNWVSRINNWNSTIEKVNYVIYITYSLIMVLISGFVLKASKVVNDAERDKLQYENLIEYSAQIENMYTDLRGFKHDYVNIMSTMSGYFKSKDYEGLEKYFNESIVPTGVKLSKDNYRLNQLKNIENVAIKGLISSKLIYAHELGVDVYIDIVEPIEDFYIKDVDLGRMMGIFFDNAIEAVKTCDTKEIRFNIAKTGQNVCITIANTYDTITEISLSQINKQGYSTKGKNRGMGLYNVDLILAKYNNVFKQTRLKDGFFIQQIEVIIK